MRIKILHLNILRDSTLADEMCSAFDQGFQKGAEENSKYLSYRIKHLTIEIDSLRHQLGLIDFPTTRIERTPS